VFFKCIHRSLGKIRHLSGATQACSQSATIIKNYHNIGSFVQYSIIGTILASHKGSLAYHVEHYAQGTPLHHDFNPLISVECAYEEYYPCVYCTC